MRYPSKAVGTIINSHPSTSTLIIDVWAKTMPIEVDVTKDGNLGDKWITGTMYNAADKMQPVKGSEIKKIPSADSVLPSSGDDPTHVVSLPLAIPVLYAHGLQLGKVTNKDLRFNADAYHPLTGLWSDTLAYQFSPATCLSGLTQKKNDVPDNQGFESHKERALPV
eukprot:12829255-Ditylum_brightwellii.AAC.1